MIAVTIALIALAFVSAWLYSRHKHSYWTKYGVETPPHTVFIGHLHKLFTPDHPFWMRDVYTKYCGSGMCGLYERFRPVLLVSRPDLVKNILVKDFSSFTDRRVIKSPNKADAIMDDMVVNENGEAWKVLRSLMTPAFSSGKMRGMFEILCQKADALVSYGLKKSADNPSVEMKDMFGRYVVDVIADCAFGFDSNSMVDEDAIFPKMAKVFSELGVVFAIKIIFLLFSSTLFKLFNIRLYSSKLEFFDKVVKDVIAARRKGEKRGDFLDLLLEAQAAEINSNKSSKLVLSDEKIVSQSALFLIAGYDTTAGTLAFTSFLLSKYPETQRRLRQELQDVMKEHDGFNYQGIMQAKYLEAVLQETLRMYPLAPYTERLCTKTYQVPETNIILKPGDVVQVPLWGLQMDEQYWTEPTVFNPDRFLPENKENITNYTHMPFGAGPRNCLAMRFALMEAKVALAKLVLSSELELVAGHEELKLVGRTGMLQVEGGVHLHMKPLKEEERKEAAMDGMMMMKPEEEEEVYIHPKPLVEE